jgi:hypothetical protein
MVAVVLVPGLVILVALLERLLLVMVAAVVTILLDGERTERVAAVVLIQVTQVEDSRVVRASLFLGTSHNGYFQKRTRSNH